MQGETTGTLDPTHFYIAFRYWKSGTYMQVVKQHEPYRERLRE